MLQLHGFNGAALFFSLTGRGCDGAYDSRQLARLTEGGPNENKGAAFKRPPLGGLHA
jgi:hypothetical protein